MTSIIKLTLENHIDLREHHEHLLSISSSWYLGCFLGLSLPSIIIMIFPTGSSELVLASLINLGIQVIGILMLRLLNSAPFQPMVTYIPQVNSLYLNQAMLLSDTAISQKIIMHQRCESTMTRFPSLITSNPCLLVVLVL